MSYRIIIFLLWPVLFLYTLKITLRDKSSRYFFQRLGFSYADKNINNKSIYWIHCASVGEVNTYMPLHHKLIEQLPDTHFIITTNTTTGASTIDKHNAARTTHCYLPVESGFAIKRFLNSYKPTRCLIMETEIWPLLYKHCARKNISISIINARLSHRTLNANHWIKGIYKNSLKQVNKILCKSEQEVIHFKQLGATDEQLSSTGNLKFALSAGSNTTKPISLSARPFCLAASTHNNEEQQLARLWTELETSTLLVIAPRHPNRSEQIQKQLNELNINYAVRSKQQAISDTTQIYIADTLGELTDFMAGAEFVFMGGSLIPHGGQNILEPARLGKTIVCGPHMYNFTDEVELLKSNNACIQVNDIKELKTTFTQLLKSPNSSMGTIAKQVLSQQGKVLENYLATLLNN